MSDFREFIRKESCDSQEYARREAAKKLAKEEEPFRSNAEKFSGLIKDDILEKSRRGEYKVVNGKRYISHEVSFVYKCAGDPFDRKVLLWPVSYRDTVSKIIYTDLPFRLFNDNYLSDLDSNYPGRCEVKILQPKGLFTPAQKRVYLTRCGKLFEEIATKLLAKDGIKLSAYFVEYQAISNSYWTDNGYTVTGKAIYKDDIVLEGEKRVIRAYKYEFWY